MFSCVLMLEQKASSRKPLNELYTFHIEKHRPVCSWPIGKPFVENIKLFSVKFHLFPYFDKIKARCDIEVVRFNSAIEARQCCNVKPEMRNPNPDPKSLENLGDLKNVAFQTKTHVKCNCIYPWVWSVVKLTDSWERDRYRSYYTRLSGQFNSFSKNSCTTWVSLQQITCLFPYLSFTSDPNDVRILSTVMSTTDSIHEKRISPRNLFSFTCQPEYLISRVFQNK